MARSDFNWLWINHTFSASASTVTKEFPIEGSQAPIDDAYLLIQTQSVSKSNHIIKINNKDLPGTDLPEAPGQSQSWLLWMKHIGPNVLRLGTNTITITRVGDEDFTVGGIAINWREP